MSNIRNASHPPSAALPWIACRPGLPYFLDEAGASWTPIGQNDAVDWPELSGLFRRRDLASVERHLAWLREHGVTCLRLMLEYAQGRHRYIERPAGRFAPNMVRLWDDLFAMCERVGMRILLTPFDTYFMWTQWRHHPYNRKNGGPCASRKQLLTCPATCAAIKARMEFATRRWGGSGALFAWDLWNEAHPAHGGDDPAAIGRFIDDVAPWLRKLEVELYGRSHPQTVSIFGPELIKHPELRETIFRHPALDFANTHLYEHGTIDNPRDTVAPARASARLIRSAVDDASDGRPVFDSEHGPIHAFKDRHCTLPESFDDEYHRHIQWAHLASGGAGGGMRWPNRHPHVLTCGMREAQAALSRFLPLIDWTRFRRHNLAGEIQVDHPNVDVAACGDEDQAILWLLRTDRLTRTKTVDNGAPPIALEFRVSGMTPGRYSVTAFDTRSGLVVDVDETSSSEGCGLIVRGKLLTDLALAVRKISDGQS